VKLCATPPALDGFGFLQQDVYLRWHVMPSLFSSSSAGSSAPGFEGLRAQHLCRPHLKLCTTPPALHGFGFPHQHVYLRRHVMTPLLSSSASSPSACRLSFFVAWIQQAVYLRWLAMNSLLSSSLNGVGFPRQDVDHRWHATNSPLSPLLKESAYDD